VESRREGGNRTVRPEGTEFHSALVGGREEEPPFLAVR